MAERRRGLCFINITGWGRAARGGEGKGRSRIKT